MRRSLLLALAGLLVVGLAFTAQPSVAAPPEPDDRVTPASDYVRHDGGSDRAIRHCSDTSTSTAPDTDPNDGDTDSNDGGAFRQGNEPSVAIDPTNPDLVFASWNDYCDTDLGGGWMGIAFSGDRGETWTPSKIPGYPSDTSVEGAASPLHNRQAEAGDPLLAFDNDGNLFAGGIAFNRVNPQNGDVWVATYANDPHPSGYPKDYLRTVVVGRGTPGLAGVFEDKPELEDRGAFRRQRLHLLVALCRRQRPDPDLLQPLHGLGPDVLAPDPAVGRQGRPRLRHRHRGRRRRVCDLGHPGHPVGDRRAGPGDHTIRRRRRILPAGPPDRDLHPLFPLRWRP
jgi:hypothetical protein